MAAQNLTLDSFWVDKPKYDEAESKYYERLSNVTLTPLADEVAKARQRLNEIRQNVEDPSSGFSQSAVDVGMGKFLEQKVSQVQDVLTKLQEQLNAIDGRLVAIELRIGCAAVECKKATTECKKPAAAPSKETEDDVDLFGSESEDDEAVAKVKEERLAAYNAKKSKKPALIAKSNIILDVKPWDDETDMEAMQKEVRKITMDGLLWGAAKLVPLAYGIQKLQISCVVEDAIVSVDLLQEQIEALGDFVQSVDIAAFNKI